MQQVHPGDSLFVYPYMPVQYFLTQARNPTRYSVFAARNDDAQPGERSAGQLQARPPEWLLYMQLSREELLRVFPNGAGLDWRFAELESWMQQNYRPVEGPLRQRRRIPPVAARARSPSRRAPALDS